MLSIDIHSLKGCGLPPELEQANIKLVALGDFPPGNQSAEVLPLNRAGATLSFPLDARALEARITDGQRSFAGYAERRGHGGLELLLWRELESCSLFRPDGALGYPGKGGGQALGYAPSLGLLLAAGGNDPLVSDALVGALTFDVGTGKVTPIDTSERRVLRQPRAFATATEFGGKLLVAGGENPVFGVSAEQLEPRATAEVYDPATAGFEEEPILLGTPRTRHAALTLPNGDTLLIGGRSKSGAESYAENRLERISPQGRLASIRETATITGRIDPQVVRLSDGRIFIGGGLTALGTLVEDPVGEWVSADGSELEPIAISAAAGTNETMPGRFGRAFVGMPGGGVLAVGGCEDRVTSSAAEAERCARECELGCAPPTYDAWWIDVDGVATSLPLDFATNGRPTPEVTIVAPRPILIPGTEGAPWLVAALESDPETPALFRFNPWTKRFAPADVMQGIARLPRPGSPQPVMLDADAFVWLDEVEQRSELVGLRLGTRNRYAQDVALISDPLDPTRPQHLAPDRPLRSAEHPEGDAVRYDGSLTLEASSKATVLITDADYADVTLTIHLTEGVPPLVVLGGQLFGGPECPWAEAGQQECVPVELPTVRRRGTRVQLSLNGACKVCNGPTQRVALGVRANPTGPSTIRQLDVKRGAD